MKWKTLPDRVFASLFPNSRRGRLRRLQRGHARAVSLYADGEYAASREQAQLNRSLAESFGNPSAELIDYLTRLGDFYHATGNYSLASDPLIESLECSRRYFGEKHIQVAPKLNDVALLLYAQGHYGEAERYFVQLMELLGECAPSSAEMATCLENQAAVLRRLDRDDESTALRERARSIRSSLEKA